MTKRQPLGKLACGLLHIPERELTGGLEIRLRAGGSWVVCHYRLPVAWRFRHSDATRYH
jgi:hypothetical protein